MDARDIWTPLASGPPDARVVVRLPDGTETDVHSVCCYAQLCVIDVLPPGPRLDDYGQEILSPGQLSDLLDANSASVEECTKMLAELELWNIDSLEKLVKALTEDPV